MQPNHMRQQLASALVRRNRFIAVVGKSPIMPTIQAYWQTMLPGRVLTCNDYGSFMNDRGYEYNPKNNVLYAVVHDAAKHPYANHWLWRILHTPMMQKQSIGIVTMDERARSEMVLQFDRFCLRYGYYPVRYDAKEVVMNDLADIYSAIETIEN